MFFYYKHTDYLSILEMFIYHFAKNVSIAFIA